MEKKSFRLLESSFSARIFKNIFISMDFIGDSARKWSGCSRYIRCTQNDFQIGPLKDHRSFKFLCRELCVNVLFYASSYDTGARKYHRIPAVDKAILCTVKGSPSKT